MAIRHGLFEGISRRRRRLNYCPTHGAESDVNFFVKKKKNTNGKRKGKGEGKTQRAGRGALLCIYVHI